MLQCDSAVITLMVMMRVSRKGAEVCLSGVPWALMRTDDKGDNTLSQRSAEEDIIRDSRFCECDWNSISSIPEIRRKKKSKKVVEAW